MATLDEILKGESRIGTPHPLDDKPTESSLPTPGFTSPPGEIQGEPGSIDSLLAGEKKLDKPLGGQDTGEKISPWEPTIFSQVKNLFSNPDKAGAEATMALVHADMFNITPSQAMTLRKPIEDGVKIDPARAKIEGDTWDVVKTNLNNGFAQVNLGDWGYQFLTGNESPEVLGAIKQTQASIVPEEEQPYTTGAMGSALAATAEMAPFLIKSMEAGAWRGMVLAGGTALMGTATGLPASITYPLSKAMYAVGQTSASLEFVGKVEAGLAFVDMVDYTEKVFTTEGDKDFKIEGINVEVARAAAYGVGAINGLIELSQLNTLIGTFPGGKKLLRGLVNETVTDVVKSRALHQIIAQTAKKYGGVITKETTQEIAQEGVNITAEAFAQKLTNHLDGTSLTGAKKQEIIDRLMETFKKSAQAFAVMGLPGSVLTGGTQYYQGRQADKSFQDQIARSAKAVRASIFQNMHPENADLPIITQEELQEFVTNPEKSSVKEEDLDAIIDNVDMDASIEEFINKYQPGLKDETLQIESPAREQIKEAVASHPKYTPEVAENYMAIWDGIAHSMVEAGEIKNPAEFYDMFSFEVGDKVSVDGISQTEPVKANTPAFKAWFQDSKVVDEKGEPLPVYHVTTEDFEAFDPDKAAMGGATWFTSDKAKIEKGETGAGLYPDKEKRTIEAYLSVQKMAGWAEYEKYGIGELKNLGYDGIKLDDNYVVFEPTQIKSTKNIGTFDPTDPRILFQIAEREDYAGEHEAPGNDGYSKPLHDMTDIYPDDIYSSNGARYYGDGSVFDQESISILNSLRGNPNKKVKVYRAVPKVLSIQEQINDYEKQKAYILKRGKLPPGVKNWENSSEYYDFIWDEVKRLEGLPKEKLSEKTKINDGDWISINRKYAVSHGKSALNNKYKIISKTVPAKHIFTDGNSIHEQGYDPNKQVFQDAKKPLGQIENLFSEDPVIIKAFAGANASTPIHETGHFLTKILHKSRPEDYKILADWVGVPQKRQDQGIESWTTKELEKSAKAFEAYVMEGKAPNKELKTVFERLKDMLIEVYKTVQVLGVEISPEVREVFDRLVTPVKTKKQTKSVKTKVRKETGQAKTEGQVDIKEKFTILEGGDKALKAALLRAVREARKAASQGNKEGVVQGKAHIRAIMERAKESQALRSEAKKIRTRVMKEIKKGLPKKDKSGKPVGVLGPEVHEMMQHLNEFVNISQKKAQKQLQDRMEKLDQMDALDDMFALENRLLHIIATPLRSVTQEDIDLWKLALEDIKTEKFEGRVGRASKLYLRSEQRKGLREAIIELLGGLSGEADITGRQVRPSDWTAKKKIRNLLFANGWDLGAVQDWYGILNVLSYNDKISAPGNSVIEKLGDVTAQEMAEKEGTMAASGETQTIFMEAYGLESKKAMHRKMVDDSIEENLGTFSNVNGNTVDLIMSRAMARKRYMELLDPSLYETFFTDQDSNGKMGWTEEMAQSVESFLTDQDIKYVQDMMGWYQGYYDSINEVYQERYGVNLPKNLFYTPISRGNVGENKDAMFGEFLKEAPFRSTTAPGSTKSRTRNMNKIILQSDQTVLMKHIMEMEHFKAWAEKIGELNAILGHTDVTRAITENFGKPAVHQISTHIDTFARGKADPVQNFDLLDKWRTNYVRSVLPAKVSIFVKQLTSVIAYADSMPVVSWVKWSAVGFAHPIKTARELYGLSTYLQERWTMASIERDILAAQKTEEYRRMSKKPSFVNKLMYNIRLGDMGAIMYGGYAVYRHHLSEFKKSGMDNATAKKKAIKIFEDITAGTQQSSDLSRQSSFQQGNSVMKLFTMFKTAPLQYLRKEISAVRNYSAGRIGFKQFFKTMLIFHVIMPVLFQWVSELFPWGEPEEEEKFLGSPISKRTARAIMLGNFNSIAIFGDFLMFAANTLTDQFQGDAVNIPPAQVGIEFTKALKELDPDEMTDEDILRAIRFLSGAVGGATGVPLKQVIDISTGIYDITTAGEYEKGIAELLGWSPWTADKRFNDEDE